MIDLDREMRVLLAEEAQRTPALPDVAVTMRRTRRRQAMVALSTAVVAVALVAGSVAGVSAIVRSSERTVIGPGLPSPAVSGCPPGSTPDEPSPGGVRPASEDYAYAQTVFDPASGRIAMLTAAGDLWTFDVCTNVWEEPTTEPLDGVRELVAGPEGLIALRAAGESWRPWVLETGETAWEGRGRSPLTSEGGFIQGPEAVVGPSTGHVTVWEGSETRLWDYDTAADRWAEIPQAGELPPTLDPDRGWDAELLTYDRSVDRLILYVGGESGYETWEFDLRSGAWTERQAHTPATGFGWVTSGDETAYDEVNEVTVLSSGGTTATYDASEGRWTVRSGGNGIEAAPEGPASRLYFAMAYDPLNGRIVVAGGDVKRNDRWHPTDSVIAYDVAADEWTELVPPS